MCRTRLHCIALHWIAKLERRSHPAFQSWRPGCQAFSKGVNQPTVMIYVPVFHHPPHPYHRIYAKFRGVNQLATPLPLSRYLVLSWYNLTKGVNQPTVMIYVPVFHQPHHHHQLYVKPILVLNFRGNIQLRRSYINQIATPFLSFFPGTWQLLLIRSNSCLLELKPTLKK